MWWRLSTDSDPATNPRASAEIHKARWTSEAEFQCKGSATGRRGETCVLQPPNIFPEWPREASDERWNLGEALKPHNSHLPRSERGYGHSQRSTEKYEGREGEKQPLRMSRWGGGGYVRLFLFRKSRKAPREVGKCHKSSHNRKHSFKK